MLVCCVVIIDSRHASVSKEEDFEKSQKVTLVRAITHTSIQWMSPQQCNVTLMDSFESKYQNIKSYSKVGACARASKNR